MKNCLDDLLNINYLSKEDYKFLKPVGSKSGTMYGLCKVHKYNSSTNDIPTFRTILLATGTATYNLAKFFLPILKEFTVNEYAIGDSVSSYREIKDQDSSLFMASFDIQYNEIDGVAMGSPLGPTFANLFLVYYEHK